ncbi:hypothetical protein BER93_14795 [Xanthomonas fragariae]|nr:hypothetical protein BER92_14760 [Xanthomonas fragariae]AOD19149.1 hypothetical protein BER93_14795 [Xanthomonas fragariae]
MLCDHRRMTDAPLLLACPSYAAMNRVEQTRLYDRPKCGNCHNHAAGSDQPCDHRYDAHSAVMQPLTAS